MWMIFFSYLAKLCVLEHFLSNLKMFRSLKLNVNWKKLVTALKNNFLRNISEENKVRF